MKSHILTEVGDILRSTASAVVMPRYGDLANSDTEMKAPGEPVTIADREAEALITSALISLLPGSRVIGEEACATNPGLLQHLDDGQAWLLDPIDGTANFAAGKTPFAMMVALLRQGETVASWILDPVTNSLAVAERGSGAWIDGHRLGQSTNRPALAQLRGIVSNAFCPSDQQPSVKSLCRQIEQVFATARCAGHEYPLVALQRRDFALYWRTLPWDHAPGALLLKEAGGSVTYLDGSDYSPSLSRTGLLLAINERVCGDVLDALKSAR